MPTRTVTPKPKEPKKRFAAPRFYVEIFEAKPNKMFTEAQRAFVRFLRYSESVKCAECGKKKRTHWTMLCSFQALGLASFALEKSGLVHPPLTPVCQMHLLAPEVYEVDAAGKGIKGANA